MKKTGRLGFVLLASLLSVAAMAQQPSEAEKPKEEAGKKGESKHRVELNFQTLGRAITVDVDGKVQQIDLSEAVELPEKLRAILPKDVLERVEKAIKEGHEPLEKRSAKMDRKPGFSGSITIVGPDGKTETRELRLDATALKSFAFGDELQKLLKDNGNLPEAAQKALEEAMKATSVVVRSNSESGELNKKLDRILERLDEIEKQLQGLKSKSE